MNGSDTDIAIVGGGLAGGLIALALRARRPELRLRVIERGARFGGNHIWSFFDSDLDPDGAALVEPLVGARWDGYTVHFPAHTRDLATPYRSITAERLDAQLRAALPPGALMTGRGVATLSADAVKLEDGDTIRAGAVIDARGPTALPGMTGGWQKFAGQMLLLDRPHGLTRPIVMDARVEQHDGYRFVYCLPFSETEIFVEDTYYSADPTLDVAALHERIAGYAEAAGWQIRTIEREETGVLPVIAGGDFRAFWEGGSPGVARAGARAVLVHPLTSYSLPEAVRLALHIARLPDLSGPALAETTRVWAEKHWRRGEFYRKLARMLFGAARPDQRYKMLERFYTMPKGLIERFYAGKTTLTDQLRILAGKPPVPIAGAVASLAGRGYPLAPLAPVPETGT